MTVLYTACGGHRLCGPNDLVFDADGAMWFTDHGKVRAHDADRVGVFYATVDGSFARRVIFPLMGPNGIGLSPDGETLYVAETPTGRLWAWDVTGPGRVDHRSRRCLANTLGHFDSLAVEADGTVVVAALGEGCAWCDPTARSATCRCRARWPPTSAGGGEGLTTAYVTEAAQGLLLACEWPRPGLALAFNR